jgi:hypothetical protein
MLTVTVIAPYSKEGGWFPFDWLPVCHTVCFSYSLFECKSYASLGLNYYTCGIHLLGSEHWNRTLGAVGTQTTLEGRRICLSHT